MSEITFTGTGDFRVPVSSVRLYSDGTPMIKLAQFAEIVENADTMIVRPKSLGSFIEAMFLVDSIMYQGGRIKKLILPYVPGARQDRSNLTGDVLFTAASVAMMINQRHFDKVLILDPHSPFLLTHISRSEAFPLERVAAKVWQGYTGIIAADKGGKARAQEFAMAMNLPIYYGTKHRDVSTGKLTGFGLDTIPFGHYLVVDDICDGGGTFIGLGEQIRKQGSFADLYVTHGIFSKGTSEMRKTYKNIYATDSRDIHDTHVMTIPVVEDMEKYNG